MIVTSVQQLDDRIGKIRHAADKTLHAMRALLAEAFAAVRYYNNRKLAKDLAKLNGVDSVHRYAFFCSPTHPELARQTTLETVPGVEVWSLPSDHLMRLPA